MNQGSRFTGWAGLAVLALLTVASAFFRIPALEAFLIALLLLSGGAFLWARLALRKLHVELCGGDCCGFPGETLKAEGSIRNGKLLPLVWLELSWPGAAKRGVGPVEAPLEPADAMEGKAEPPELVQRFAWLLPHQTLHWQQKALALHRGVYPLRRAELRSGDGFGLCVRRSFVRVEGGARFVVYPALHPVEVGPILRVLRELEPAKNGLYVDRTLLNTVRDWREGDSAREINWRILARTDTVQVNVHERLDARRLCFVPDLFSFSRLEEATVDGAVKTVRRADVPALERMLSLLASLVTELSRREVLCTLALPAMGKKPPRLLIPECREEQALSLLTALAEISYDGQELSLPVDALQAQHHLLGQIFVLSRDPESAVWRETPALAEELGIYRIYQTPLPEGALEPGVFQEKDFGGL